MITITVQKGLKLKNTNFETYEDLAFYLFERFDYGKLLPLKKELLSLEQKNRMDEALKKSKSEMFNI